MQQPSDNDTTTPGAGRRRRAARWAAAAAGAAVVAAAAVLAVTTPWSGPSTTSDISAIHQQLAQRLAAKHLDVQEITCIRNGRRFDGAGIVRCNVNFGDPHVVAYCSVLRDGELLTSADDASIPCTHDDVGWSAPIQVFG